MRIKLLLLFIFISVFSYSQVRTNSNNIFYAKEFSKDIALFNSKQFLFKNILGVSSEIVKFEVIPLAASSSGELTTLLYRCEEKGKEGLLLGFYGNYWNESGVVYQGFAFKNFEKDIAIDFLNKIQSAIDENKIFLKDDISNNNIYFKYDDIEVLIYSSSGMVNTIRLFWNGFDSNWEEAAFNRSKRRFEKQTK